MGDESSSKRTFGMKFNVLALVIVLVMGATIIYESDDNDSDVQPQAVYTYSASGYVTDGEGVVMEDMVVSGDMVFTVLYRSGDTLCCSFESSVIATDGITEMDYSAPYMVYLDAETFAPDVSSSGTETLSTVYGDVECERYVEDMMSYMGEKLTLYSNSDDKTIYRFDIVSEGLVSSYPAEEGFMYIELQITDRDLELGIFGTSSTVGRTSEIEAVGWIQTYDDTGSIATDLPGKIVITKVADSTEVISGMAVEYYTINFTVSNGDRVVFIDGIYGVRSDGTVLGADKLLTEDGSVLWVLHNESSIMVDDKFTNSVCMYAVMLDARNDAVGGLMIEASQTYTIVDGELVYSEPELILIGSHNVMDPLYV
ncbi:MAG: hypothetical protein WCR24_02160 [Candidatus Methanomethylophilaceae archaeon]